MEALLECESPYTLEYSTELVSCVLRDGRVLLTGGNLSDYPYLLVSLFDSSYWIDGRNIQRGDLPCGRIGYSLCCGVESDTVVVFGGFDGTTKFNDIYVGCIGKKLQRLQWMALGSNPKLPATMNTTSKNKKGVEAQQKCVFELPSKRDRHAACLATYCNRSVMLVHGGIDADSHVLNDLWMFDFSTDSWLKLQPSGNFDPFLAYHTLSSVNNGNQVVCCGGYNGENLQGTLAVLDLASMSWMNIVDLLPPICMHAACTGSILSIELLCRLKDSCVSHTLPKIYLWKSQIPSPEADARLLSTEPDVIYIVGGIMCSGALNSEVLVVRADASVNTLTLLNPIKNYIPCALPALATLGHSLLFSGGSNSITKHRRNIYVLHPNASIYAPIIAPNLEASSSPSDNSYIGTRDSEGMRAGKGSYTFENLDKYTGEWENNLPHGTGEMTYHPYPCPSSTPRIMGKISYYTGTWVYGKIHGNGEAHYIAENADESNKAIRKYKGDFSDELPDGTGRGDYFDGSVYIGGWSNGLHHGFGKFFCGDIFTEGKWMHGELARGKQSGPDCKYSGDLRNYIREGKGRCTYNDGSVHSGSYRSGRANGQGYYFNNITREMYKGKFVGGNRCGAGACLYPSGHLYTGIWEAGKIKDVHTILTEKELVNDFFSKFEQRLMSKDDADLEICIESDLTVNNQ